MFIGTHEKYNPKQYKYSEDSLSRHLWDRDKTGYRNRQLSHGGGPILAGSGRGICEKPLRNLGGQVS